MATLTASPRPPLSEQLPSAFSTPSQLKYSLQEVLGSQAVPVDPSHGQVS